jgi:hypothetical protein
MAFDPGRDRFPRWAAGSEWTLQSGFTKPGLFQTPAAALFTVAWWCLPMLVGAIVALLSIQKAFAHDPKHPEWTSWLMSQHNQNDAICCDGNDNEWRTNNGHYEVFYDGGWHEVPEWALTRSRDNITGNALLWVWQGHVQCFKPGTFY